MCDSECLGRKRVRGKGVDLLEFYVSMDFVKHVLGT